MRYRRFSIAAALASERGPMPPPLARGDDDAAIVADASKLRCAARLMEGRPVKLLPDQE